MTLTAEGASGYRRWFSTIALCNRSIEGRKAFITEEGCAAGQRARQLQIEKEFSQTADFVCIGFGSLWMMSDRVHCASLWPTMRSPRFRSTMLQAQSTGR